MIRIKIKDRRRYKPFTMEVEEDIPIYLMDQQFCELSHYPMEQCLKYFYRGKVLDYNRTLSDYNIRDGDIIELMDNSKYFEKYDNYIIEHLKEGGEGGFHICPYGCGRQIPDGYKGCTELLQAQPNYFW